MGKLVLFLLAMASTALTAEAATLKTKFFAQSKARELEVDKDHVVVRRIPGFHVEQASHLTARERAAFDQMGLVVVARDKVRSVDNIVGYPIWFDRSQEAVGVLTHEIVVRLGNNGSLDLIKRQPEFATAEEVSWRPGLFRAKFKTPMAALDAANALFATRGVIYAHPDFLIPKSWRAPSDEPLYRHQWHLENAGQWSGKVGADIDVLGAWEITQGSSDVIVAVLDGGFEVTHPDLGGVWQINTGEIPGNGRDDDDNGYVDDILGWNFWDGNGNPAGGAYSDHGTAVAGLVGAPVNGKGVTGVCPNCKMIPVVVSWQVSEDAEAFYYAKSRGAHIITNSWGYPVGTPRTDVIEEAINAVARTGRDGKGTIILFAMNNINKDDCIGNEPDISSLDSVIAVSASSDLDKKVSFSAWGDCMEFLSPSYESGRPGIATTDLTGTRGYNNGRNSGDLEDLDYTNDFGGTSAATPIAAGVFGLMLSVNPDLTRDEALSLVLATAEKINPSEARYDPATGFSNKYGYGRINAARAVRAAQVFRKYSSAR